MQLDRDAVQWSTPERERADRPLIVLLHGYGSHEGDLFALSPRLPLGATVASVRAPMRESGGFAWWSLAGQIPGTPDPVAVDAGANAVLDWLDTVEATSISLLGFSQGGAIALQLLRLAPDRFTSAVCVAGFIGSADHAGDARLAELRPPVFWGRGTADAVIPAAAVDRTAEWLEAHTTPTIRIYEDLGHSISTQELSDLTGFLAEHA